MSTKRYLKPVSFGASDTDILEYIDTLDEKFSSYVKRLIRQDMMDIKKDSDVMELLKGISNMMSSGVQFKSPVDDAVTKPSVDDNQKSAIANILRR